MLKCFQHLLVYSLAGLCKVLSSLRMTKDYIFYSYVSQHVRGDLSGVSTFLLKVHILCTNLDIGTFSSFHYRNDVDCRYAENYICIFCCYQRFQCVNQLYCLTRSHVHLPVSGNNFLSSHFLYPPDILYKISVCS